MKNLIFPSNFTWVKLILVFTFLLFACNNKKTKINISQDPITSKTDSLTETIWHIKAVHPDGKLLDVKAIDKNGKFFDVKAIQISDQSSILDIKAFVNNKQLPVKILVSEDKYMPVKAIDTDGTILDIKALTSDGEILDIKGVSQSGNIINIKAITKDGEFYGVKAISPKGWLNDVKGIKNLKDPVEEIINGVEVYAHVKGLTQSYY